MRQELVVLPTASKRLTQPRWPLGNIFAIVLSFLSAAVLICTWYSTRTHVLDLVNEQQVLNSGLYTEWAKGNVLVLIRHAERCDRSHNACLNDPTGITVAGSQVAAEVGKGIQALGLKNTQMLSSPQVRTEQTARFAFNEAIPTQNWLNQCDSHFSGNAINHKQPGHNMVLITHSGCIDQLERSLRVPGNERASAYASALFVTVDISGNARILGQMNANTWHNLTTYSGN